MGRPFLCVYDLTWIALGVGKHQCFSLYLRLVNAPAMVSSMPLNAMPRAAIQFTPVCGSAVASCTGGQLRGWPEPISLVRGGVLHGRQLGGLRGHDFVRGLILHMAFPAWVTGGTMTVSSPFTVTVRVSMEV